METLLAIFVGVAAVVGAIVILGWIFSGLGFTIMLFVAGGIRLCCWALGRELPKFLREPPKPAGRELPKFLRDPPAPATGITIHEDGVTREGSLAEGLELLRQRDVDRLILDGGV